MDQSRAAGSARGAHSLIVVGLTATPASRAALQWASDYARDVGGRLRAVCVHPHKAIASPGAVHPDQRLDWSVQARQTVDLEFSAVHPDPAWTLIQMIGDPGPDLVRTARDADLLVIGRHQISPDSHRAQVTAYCAEASMVPLVIVPVPAGPQAVDNASASSTDSQADR